MPGPEAVEAEFRECGYLSPPTYVVLTPPRFLFSRSLFSWFLFSWFLLSLKDDQSAAAIQTATKMITAIDKISAQRNHGGRNGGLGTKTRLQPR